MALSLSTVVLDATDMKRALAFWSAALGYEAESIDNAWISLADPKGKGVGVGLQPNPDRKTDANRVHLDLAASDVQAEVKRLAALGAKRIPWEYAPGASYVVMQDTEGNEFCIVSA